MISSMTGYGKSVIQKENYSVEAEIKSLNSRYLDTSIKLPKSISGKELELRDIINNYVKRGKISVTVSIKQEGVEDKYAFLDRTALNSAINFLKEIRQKADIKDEITLDHILAFQTMYFSDAPEDIEKEFDLVKNAVSNAMEEIVKMRRQEGENLVTDLEERLTSIENSFSEIEKIAGSSVDNHFEKLKEKAKKLVENIEDYGDRLEAELALLAEKYDVTEEIVRMRSHIKMFRDVLANSEEAGRKLNFITQEMNREVNTVNSKSVSTEISQLGIGVKEELEKIREQIQNIE